MAARSKRAMMGNQMLKNILGGVTSSGYLSEVSPTYEPIKGKITKGNAIVRQQMILTGIEAIGCFVYFCSTTIFSI